MSILFKTYRWILWNVLTRFFLIKLFLKPKYRYTLASGSERYPAAPFLLVANHGTFFDPWIVGSYSTTPVGYMTNDDGFRDGAVTRWYLKSIGAFPKKKGSSDYRAMKTTLDLLKKGSPVCIFPEGQTTWDGETQLLYRGIEKLVKRAGCPLVAVRLQGNFLTKPWWAKSTRTGRISISTTVFTPEKIGAMSDDDLFSAMYRAIYQNDIKDPANLTIPFSGDDLAAGLERFVWLCLRCSAEDTLVSNGNAVTCTSCGCSIHMDAHCRLSVPSGAPLSCADLKDWAEFHKTFVKNRIAVCPAELTRSTEVVRQEEDERKRFIDRDRGTLLLSADRLRFESNGNAIDLPVAEIENYVIQKKDILELDYKKTTYRFLFSGHSPMKWIYYLRYLKGFEECERQGHL